MPGMYSLIPVLSVFARILVAFSPAFFVPLAWTFVLDAQEQVLLHAGDTATLVVDSEHRLANAADTTARLLLLVLSPLA